MKELNERLGTATILITHNLGCASSICDRIIVMYGGKIMEEGTTEEIFYEPHHPYTMGLLNSVPKVTGETGSDSWNTAGYASSTDRMSVLSALQICNESMCIYAGAGTVYQ